MEQRGPGFVPDQPSSAGFGPGTVSLMVVLAASVWGVYWYPLRMVEAAGVGPAWAVVLMTAAPVPIVTFITWRKRQDLNAQLAQMALVGFCIGGAMLLYAFGLVYSSVVRATLLFYLTPIWGTLIGRFWLSEAVGAKRWIAIALAVGGLIALLNPGGQLTVPLNIGDAFGLVSGMLWAMGAASLKRFPELPLHASLTFQYGISLLIGLLLALWLEPLPTLETIDWLTTTTVVGGFSWLVILPTLYVCMWCAQRLAPGRIGLLMMSEVMVAVISAAVLLPEESLSSLEWAGAALIVCAGVVEVRARKPG